MIELADLFIGAVGYQYNNRSDSEIKVEFCSILAQRLNDLTPKYFKRGNLNTFTSKDEKKFNIYFDNT